MNVKNIVSTNLRRLREQRKLTQQEASEAMEIAFPTYRSWEYGRSIPNADIMPKGCKFCGVSPHELFIDLEAEKLPRKENPVSVRKALEVLSQFVERGEDNQSRLDKLIDIAKYIKNEIPKIDQEIRSYNFEEVKRSELYDEYWTTFAFHHSIPRWVSHLEWLRDSKVKQRMAYLELPPYVEEFYSQEEIANIIDQYVYVDPTQEKKKA